MPHDQVVRTIQKTRAANLAAALEQLGVGANAKVARRMGVDPSYISNLRNGRQVIGDEAATKLERAMSLPAEWLDTKSEGEHSVINDLHWSRVPLVDCSKLPGLDDPVPVALDHVMVRTSVLESAQAHGGTFCATECNSAAMEPTIRRGDLMVVELGRDHIKNRRIYLYRWGKHIQIGRLFEQPDGSLMIRGDNPDRGRYPEQSARPDMEGFEVIGRAHWRGGFI